MRKIVITGGSGFVGAHTVSYFAEKDYEVHVFSRSEVPSNVQNAASSICLLDLADACLGEALSKINPDVILHTAACATPGACDKDPEGAKRSNIDSVRKLVHAAENLLSPPLLIFVSTDMVFDGKTAPAGGLKENDEPSPVTLYSKTKLEGETIVSHYRGKGVITRTSLVYGSPIGARGSFIQWMTKGLREGAPLTLFFDEWRTPIHVDDLCEGFRLIDSSRDRIERGEIFHIGGPERIARDVFGEILAEELGVTEANIVRASVKEFSDGPLRPSDITLNIEKAASRLGFAPRAPREGIGAYVKEA